MRIPCLSLYADPVDRAPLRLDGDLLMDRSGRRYPVKEGIPDFLLLPPAETPEVVQQLDRLNALAAEVGWRAALADVYASDRELIRYVTDPGRAGYLELLPLTTASVVLEVGAGLGQCTWMLGRRCREVCALEVVEGQARFVLQRCRQEGADNVAVACGGDAGWLPYKDSCFDAAICNLVLEWCGSRNQADDPVETQNRLLHELCRVLKPGGVLYLATKNRFALRYLMGQPDEHVHMVRFGSVLPRWLIRRVLSLRGKGRAPGVLHSHGALKRMLYRAGFGQVTSYWAAPEMRYPTQLVCTDAGAIRQARRDPRFAAGPTDVTRRLMSVLPATLVRQVTPGLAFLAKRESVTTT